MKLPLYIAKRYLVAKKSQNAINIISWISILSIGIGTFALVVVLSAFNGLEGLVESLFESFDSDIRIEVKEGKVFSIKEVPLDELEKIDGVLQYTQVLEEVCGVRYKQQDAIVSIKGVENSFLEMSGLDSALVDGDLILEENGINYAITGYGIASQLGLYLAKAPEYITVYAPKRTTVSTLNPMNSVYRKLIVPGGVFYISPEYDTKYMVVPLQFAQDLLKYTDEVSAIELSVDDKRLDDITSKIQELLSDQFSVTNRLEFNQIIYKTNKTEKWVTFLILVFILIIAAFNILGSLSMLILEKKKDIETLRYLGAKPGLIRKIFFIQGALINLTGAFTGLFLGVVVCLLQEHVGIIELEGGIVEYYPVELNPLELVYILITVFVIGFLTSWFPVRNLTKVTAST